MLVTDIRRIDDKRFCLYMDYEPFGPLYQSDIKRLKLDIGQDVAREILEDFRKNFLYKRAMDKAISSIKYSEKCEYDIRRKLEELYFDHEIIDFTIDKLKSYDYINDERYASMYIRTHINNKSRKNITYMLLAKNISSEIIEEAFEINELPDEEEVISRLILKKYKPEDISLNKDKIISSMLRKGYSYGIVQKCLNEMFCLDIVNKKY